VAEELSGIEVSQIEALAGIKQEQLHIQGLREKAAALKEKVEAPVYERVVRDYDARVGALEARARPLRDQARGELAKLRALHERLSAALKTARLELQEVEFRHEVGELGDEDFDQRRQVCQQMVEERTKAFDEAEQLLQRFLEVLPATPEPAPPPPAPVVAPAAVVAPAPVVPAAPGPAATYSSPPPRTEATEMPDRGTLATLMPGEMMAEPSPRGPGDPLGTVVVVGARLIEQKEGREGRMFPLGRVTTLGRTPDNDIAIEERAVSRRHARITFTDAGFVITDLNSGNGTYVNGKRTTECRLAEGDRVELGNSCLVFKAS
jgi:hypothetical protein